MEGGGILWSLPNYMEDEIEYGTFRTSDCIPMRLAVNWTESCNGGNACVRIKIFVNISAVGVVYVIIFRSF